MDWLLSYSEVFGIGWLIFLEIMMRSRTGCSLSVSAFQRFFLAQDNKSTTTWILADCRYAVEANQRARTTKFNALYLPSVLYVRCAAEKA
jgi:hypothetical protein